MQEPGGDIWLDSARKQTLLPGSPWYKIENELLPKLAESVVQHFTETRKKVILCGLLGKMFVETFLPRDWLADISNDIMIEEDKVDKETVIEEIKQWLHKEISGLAVKHGLSTECDETNMTDTFINFYGFTHKIIHSAMEEKLATVEKKMIDRQNTRRQRGKPNFKHSWGHQSECLGSSLSALVKDKPASIKHVCRQLMGRQLPYSFRETLWQYQLINCARLQESQGRHSQENTPPDFRTTDNHLKDLLKDFKYKFQRSLGREDETPKPFSSGVSGIIQHSVQESYNQVYGLQESETKRLINMACIVLDLLYVANQIYEPRLALLLMPLLLVFYKYGRVVQKEEIAVKLAVNLQQLSGKCLPSLPRIFSISEQVINRLRNEDNQLYQHLITASKNNISTTDPEEFLVQYIHAEKEKAQGLARRLSTRSFVEMSADSKDLLTHPLVFIRKWLAESFVSSLDMRATLFIWDQCFMTGWSTHLLENTCLALLELLKPQLLEATDYQHVKEVMLLQPAFLYTLHVQKAVMHLYNRGNVMDILGLVKDQEIPELPSDSDARAQSQTRRPEEHPFTPQPGPSNVGADVPSRKPVPARTATPSLGPYWVEHDESHDMPQRITDKDPFDVYIDAVRFIPDNATIIKVTGRIFHPDWTRLENFEDIQAFTSLDSPGRCPQVDFKVPLKPGSTIKPCPDGVLVLRVYTVDFNSDNKDMVVIGSCVFQLYDTSDDQVSLQVGGHQLRLFHNLPSTDQPLSEKTFSKLIQFPAASLLIRILPHSKNVVTAPEYSSGYYQSESCRPTESEERIYQHYLRKDTMFPALVRDAVVELMDSEKVDSVQYSQDDTQLLRWYRTRLGKHILQGQPAQDLDLQHAISYQQTQGLAVQVTGAHGLPNAHISHVFVYVVQGRSTHTQDVTEEGYGGEEKFLTKSLDMNSHPKSPKWVDKPTVFHPHFNKKTFLVLQLFTLDVVYTPRQDRAGPGMLEGKRGKDPALVPQGWAAVPLFNRSCVNGGIHHLPLLQGTAPVSFLDFVSSHSVEMGLTEGTQQKVLQLQGTSSIDIRLWDGHFTDKECLPLPENTSQLSLVGRMDKYMKTAGSVTGKPLSDLVIQTLSRDGKKQGIAGLEYQREKGFFEESINMTFYNLMENVCLRFGMAPLEWT